MKLIQIYITSSSTNKREINIQIFPVVAILSTIKMIQFVLSSNYQTLHHTLKNEINYQIHDKLLSF